MQIICIKYNYWKPYKYLKTNDYHWIGIITLNHIIVYKILVLGTLNISNCIDTALNKAVDIPLNKYSKLFSILITVEYTNCISVEE